MATALTVAGVWEPSTTRAAPPASAPTEPESGEQGDPPTPAAAATAASAPGDAGGSPTQTPVVTAATVGDTAAPKPTVEPDGTWAPTGLSGRSAFNLPVAEVDDPYGRRPPSVPAVTLDQVTRFALDNPLVRAADEKVHAVEALLDKARYAWIPVIETTTALSPGANIECDDVQLDNGTTEPFSFQFCRAGGDPDLDISKVSGYFSQLGRAGVRFSFKAQTIIPVFSFGRKLKHLKDLGKAGVALAKLTKMATEQETVLLVQQAHVTLLLARESQAVLREAKGVLDKAYRRVVKDVGDPDDWGAEIDEGGERDPDDLTRVELAAVELEVKMREALKVEALALAALWALGGKAAPDGFDIAERALPRVRVRGGLAPVSHYIDAAQSTRPEAKMAAAAVKARKAQERLARAAFLPDMGIAVSFGAAVSNAADGEMSQLYYQDGFNYTRITAALAMRWRWDTGAIFDLRRARAIVRSQEHQREASKLLLARDVHTAYQDVVEAKARLEATERATKLAWRLVLSAEISDAGGSGNARDLLKALEKWYTKRFDGASAVHAHSEAIARLSRAVGAAIPTESDSAHTAQPGSSGAARSGAAGL